MTGTGTRPRRPNMEAEILTDAVGHWVQVRRKDGEQRTFGPYPRSQSGQQQALDLQGFFRGN